MVGAVLVTIVLPSATPAGTSSPRDPPLTFIVFWGGGEHGVPERASIFVADLNGNGIRQLTSAKKFAQAPVWSPHARRIAYEQDGDVYVMDRNGKHRRRVVVGGYDPRWSPSGKWLALPAGDHGIQIVNIATRRSHYLRPKVGFVLPALDWSPDGRTIAFTVEDQDLTVLHSEIYTINADGSNVRKLVSAPPGFSLDNPRWSPNGKRLLYTREPFLYLANADGSNQKRLIRIDTGTRASWSWDGRRIIYGVVDIRLLNLRTGARRTIDLRPCRRYACMDLDWSRTR
jgi:Tol biopolymer transport system component